jgi:hypothetical protein
MANNHTEPVSKMEAVRLALAEGKSSPKDGAAYIKATFGIDMSPNFFSSYKSKLGLGAGKRRKKRGRKAKAKAVAPLEVAVAAAPRPKAPPRDTAITLDVIRQVKELVDRHGAETLKKVVGLLGG